MAVSMQNRRQSSLVSVDEVVDRIKYAAQQLDGLTISGGEPFEQADALYALLLRVKTETQLDIMVYSGYTLDELRAQGMSARRILETVDILIDGRFKEHESNRKLWRGSDNQRFLVLSKRAQKYSRFAEAEYEARRQLTFEVGENNTLKIIGIPERGFHESLERAFKAKGLSILRGN